MIGLVWFGFGLDWIGLDWIGLDWIGLDWIGIQSSRITMQISLISYNRQCHDHYSMNLSLEL